MSNSASGLFRAAMRSPVSVHGCDHPDLLRGMVKVTPLALRFVRVAVSPMLGGRWDLSWQRHCSPPEPSRWSPRCRWAPAWVRLDPVGWRHRDQLDVADHGCRPATAGTSVPGLRDHRHHEHRPHLGLLVRAFWVVRMLWASSGRVHPVGGSAGPSVVVFFPSSTLVRVAVMPLAAWANQRLFRLAVILSVVLSFFILPRMASTCRGDRGTVYLISRSLVPRRVGCSLYRRKSTTGYTRQP